VCFKKKMSSMTGSKAYLRHMKQYVQAPLHQFAAITPPELTTICYDELVSLGFSEAKMTDAGVEFLGKLRSCYMPNLCLRTASRILCRLPPFRAGMVQELFHKVSISRWELWLNPRIPLELRTFVEHSRISHEGLVAQTVAEAIGRRFHSHHLSPPVWLTTVRRDEGECPTVPPLKQRILVHLRKNHCQISLDTTGDHLHRRGYRLEHTGAPLRETLAAAILLRSKWKGEVPLIDAMCGSGTVSIEAALLARRFPPGLTRSFLFELWPSFQEKSWAHLQKRMVEKVLAHAPSPVLAVDSEPKALTVARKNAERAGVDGDIRWQCLDFFIFKPQDFQLPPGLLVLDPPYGKRLESGGKELYERLGNHLRRFFDGWQTAILAPSKALATCLKIPSMRFWQISHGGIPIVVVLGRL
jgi:putative N6-adenine-specific DNA methylase